MKRVVVSIVGAAHRWSQRLAGAAVLGLLAMAVATLVDVVLRYGFASPIRGFVDIAGLTAAVLLSACMPHVVACRGNISIDFVGRALGPRTHSVLDRLGRLATFGLFAVMAWQVVAFAADMRSTGETTPVLRWPVWPWWAGVAIFISVAAVVSLATLAAESEGTAA